MLIDPQSYIPTVVADHTTKTPNAWRAQPPKARRRGRVRSWLARTFLDDAPIPSGRPRFI